MEQRLLGKSGLSMSVLSLGTMTIGGRDRFQHMGTLGVTETKRMLDICSDAGVTVIDTADMYSFGGSEEILGEALEGKRQQFIIVTKVFMRVGQGVHDIGLSRKHIMESCEGAFAGCAPTTWTSTCVMSRISSSQSRRRCARSTTWSARGRSATSGARIIPAWHVMKALAVSARQTFPRLSRSRSTTRSWRCDVEHEMVPMGLDQGVGLMAWSPLHFGLLSGKFRRDARPSETRLNQLDAPGTVDLERLYRIVDVLTEIGQERNVSPAQVALNWVMHKPGVDTVTRRAQRGAAARQPRGGDVAADQRGNGQAGRGERPAGTASVLAPAQIRAGENPRDCRPFGLARNPSIAGGKEFRSCLFEINFS